MIQNKKFSIALLLIMLVSLIPAPLQVHAQGEAGHADVQPDGSGVKDVTIRYQDENGNLGNATTLQIAKSTLVQRSMIGFGLTGIPFNAGVTAATLQLTLSATTTTANTLEVYAVRQDFYEGATWRRWGVNYFFNEWQTAGATGALDITGLIGSVAIPANTASGTVISVELTDPSPIQAMIRQDMFGFFIKATDESTSNGTISFYSSDASTSTNRPKLSFDYNSDDPFYPELPTWECVAAFVYSCDPPLAGVKKQVWTNQSGGGSAGYGDPASHTSPTGGALDALYLNCNGVKRCWNDFPIYYKFSYDVAWTAAGSTNATLVLMFDIPGGGYIKRTASCGAGASYHCTGVFEGYITTDQLPANSTGNYLLGFRSVLDFPTTWPILGSSFGWNYVISLKPFDQNCDEQFVTPDTSIFTINQTVETPLGALGSPPDEMIYNTTVGSTYMVYVENNWYDGVTPDPRIDAAVSFDGTTWMDWAKFKDSAVCVDYLPSTMYEPDYWIVYFTATTETFYIRSNDSPGAFANNTIDDPYTPFQYVIGEAFGLAETDCASQFTYDPGTDWLLSAVIQGTNPDALVNNAAESQHLQPGEWYAIEVASGTWNEPASDPRIDMEYLFEGLTGTDYGSFEDLATGGKYVTCAADNIVYVQAPAELLHLRVNDLDGNFGNNQGYLGINVYHAAFTRSTSTCELNFALDDLVRSDSVDAKQQNGKVFALTVGSALTTSGQSENFLSTGLVPGAYYVLETSGGPWGYLGDGKAPAATMYSLDVAETNVGATPAESDWVDLASWTRPECNVETDTLGHRMIYFQMPITDAKQFSLRVSDISDWNNNTGSMSWNLYRAIDLGPADSGLCDYSFDPEQQLNNGVVLTVRANDPDGAYIGTGPTPGEPVGTYDPLQPDTYYAVEILSNFVWYDSIGSDPSTEAELSLNNGTTWKDIPGGGELCTVEQGGNTIFFIHTQAYGTPQFKLRVNSTTFADNAGFLGYNIYLAQAGTSIDNTDGCVTAGYSTTAVAPFQWIPVTDPTGISVASSNPASPEIGGLVAGNSYIIEISRGPWYDGESTYPDGRPKEFYSAELSSDNGVTWQPMNGHNTDVTCWEYSSDMKYYKVEFTVQSGQIWRIRVADAGTTFTDNTGNLAYTLQGMVLPADTPIQGGTFTLAGCNTPPVFPGLLSFSDLLNLGNYLASWFDYAVGSVVKFFAWCPENTDMVTMFAEDINKRDPFAMFDEMDGVLNDIKNEINGYSWGTQGTDYSILTKSPAAAARMIDQYIFGPLPDDSPWINGDLVDFTVAPPTNIYADTCNLAISDYLGPKLGQGVCFTINWARNTGLIFYMQLMLDVGVVFLALHSILDNFRRVIYLFTGVNLSIMKSDQKVFVNLINENNSRGQR